MKKNMILVILLGIAPSKFLAQSQLEIDPYSTIQQLYLVGFSKDANDYYSCGRFPNGSDFGLVVKFNQNQIFWNNYFETSYVPVMTISSSGGVIVGVERIASGFVSKIDVTGNLTWITNISSGGEYFTDVLEVSNNDIFAIGATFGNTMFVVKLSPLGSLIWERRPILSSGLAEYPRILLRQDSLLLFDGTVNGIGISGDIALRILDQNCVESFHRTYGIPGNVRDQLTSVVKTPSGYTIATVHGNEIGIINLDQSFNISNSRTYTTSIGGSLADGKLLYDSGYLYLAGARYVSGASPRAFLAKLDPVTLGVVWTKPLSSANSVPSCEPFMDATIRVPYMRFPSLNGSVRGVMLASIDPTTGNFTGTLCESPPTFSLIAGPYTGLVQTDQAISVWLDLTVVSPPSYNYGSYPLLLEDCEPGILPIELLYFVGIAVEEKSVRLSWATGSEEDVSRFSIERSLDLENWETVVEVSALGRPGVGMNYSIVDDEPNMGQVNYYRLRETDVSGESATFNIVPVHLGLEDFIIYPNPVRRGDVLRPRVLTTLDIFDALGRPVVRNSRELIVNLPPGNYIVSTTTELGFFKKTRLVVVE